MRKLNETADFTSTKDVNMAQASSPESPNKLELEDDFMHYYVVDGVRLPPFCRGKSQDIAEFPVRSDDVWILSYPRAGKSTFRVRNSIAHFLNCSRAQAPIRAYKHVCTVCGMDS